MKSGTEKKVFEGANEMSGISEGERENEKRGRILERTGRDREVSVSRHSVLGPILSKTRRKLSSQL